MQKSEVVTITNIDIIFVTIIFVNLSKYCMFIIDNSTDTHSVFNPVTVKLH